MQLEFPLTQAPKPKLSRYEYQKEWAKNNRDKRNEYRRRWIAKNPEKAAAYAVAVREHMRLKRLNNKDYLNKQARENYANNRETHKAKASEYRKNNKEKVAISKRIYFFGRDGNDYYMRQLALQEGKCAICTRTADETGRSLGLDHDHRFDAKDPRGWRGLLCKFCNAGIGNFREDINLLGGAARRYIEYWREKCHI